MTPPFESSEPRRSFVKKTLATSVSISFAGLIRAHGEEGGGTTVPETAGTTESSTVEETAGTTDPPTEEETVGTSATYKLLANRKGTEISPGNWNSYSEIFDSPTVPDLTTVIGNKYRTKIKVWVHPPQGEDAAQITIEYCAEFCPNGVVTPPPAAVCTSDKVVFVGILPDPHVAAMVASLGPASFVPNTPLKSKFELGTIPGALNDPRPANLAVLAYNYAKSHAPAGATHYQIVSGLTLELFSVKDFTNLPSKASVKVTVKTTNVFHVRWFDSPTSATPVQVSGSQTGTDQAFDGLMEIQVVQQK